MNIEKAQRVFGANILIDSYNYKLYLLFSLILLLWLFNVLLLLLLQFMFISSITTEKAQRVFGAPCANYSTYVYPDGREAR